MSPLPPTLVPPLHSSRNMRAGLVLGVVFIAGCYNPRLRDCAVQCSGASDCTGDQVCADGWCTSAGVTGRCHPTAETADASGIPPGIPIDAPDNAACLAACTNGTCDRGVCVIDCSTPFSCQTDVLCPGSVPCRVVCGDRACQHHVDCQMASTCEIQCTGMNSCADEVRCGANRCSVTCSGASSCKHVRCSSACACDATCSGVNACIELSDCPQAGACKLGEGCTSDGSCDRC